MNKWTPSKTLNTAKLLLFGVGVLGQMLFALYIFIHFGGTAIKGESDSWAEGMIHGIIEGDPLGNFALFLHLFLAFVITVRGPLQFIPALRNKARKFHKYNGRIYIFTALLISIGALFMIWHREATVGGELGRIATSGNGVLIIVFAILAWRTAMQGDFINHRKWALRTFIVVSGVWFFRIIIGLWILLTNFNAYGMDNNLTGPFDRFAYFGSYLLPLLILELYFRAKESKRSNVKYGMSAFMLLLSLLLLGGIAMAAMIFWIPELA